MAFVVKFAKTIRNNWKKSVFFTAVSLYGVKYARDKYSDEQIRRVYCEKAKQYGYQHITLTQKPKKIYVFLNPASHGNNGKKLFESNAAPLLHLAGFEVVLVKTEYESQAKEFMSVLEVEDVHSIIVAGGDGTLSEVVTGILRKGNRQFEKTVPLGILPLGNTNRFARRWFNYGKDKNEVAAIAETAMAVIKGQTKKVDVLSIKGDDDKTTYALSGLEIGAYRDAVARKNKYWYFGPLKFRWTYIRTLMKDWPPIVKGQLVFIPEDAVATSTLPDKSSTSTKKPQEWSWWNLFFRSRVVSVEVEDDDVDELFDAESELSKDISTVELTLMSGIYSDDSISSKPKKHQMLLGIGPSSPSRLELLKEGWRRIRHESLQFGTVSNEQITARKVKFSPEGNDKEDLWFSIDGEHYEAKPVEVTVLRNRLSFFCSDQDTDTIS